MSNAWHWYIAILTVINIVACLWLISWTSRQGDTNKEDMDTLDHVWDGNLQERNNPLPRWWLFLFVGTIIWGFGYLAWYPGLGAFKGMGNWSQLSQYEEERERNDQAYQQRFASLAGLSLEQLGENPDAVEIGSRVFAENCMTCHGSDARGAKGFPNLADGDWLYGNSADAIFHSVTQGRNGVMPAWGTVLGDDGVKEVIEYVKLLSGSKHARMLATAGKEHYDKLCVACHAADGSGVQALGGANLKDDVWLYGASGADMTESIANGRNGNMPSHSSILSTQESRMVVAYVLSLQNTGNAEQDR